MFLKNITTILILLLVKKTSSLINIRDIYNIRSFDLKLLELKDKIRLDVSQFNNATFNSDIQNEKLQVLLQNLVDVLTDLNEISVFERTNQSSSFHMYLKKFEKYKVKFDQTQNSLIYFFSHIDERGIQTENLVNMFLNLYKSKYLNTMKRVCQHARVLLEYTVTRSSVDSIVSLFTEFVENLYDQMNTPDWRNSCEQHIPLRQEIFNYYRSVITVQIKKELITWFATLIHNNCPYQMKYKFLANPISQLREEVIVSLQKTKKIILLVKHYMYGCDAKTLDRDDRKTYYELEKMIQVTIIEEQYLSTTGSCSHNCEIESIADTLNHTECESFHQCQYIGPGFDICKSDGTDSRQYEWFKDSYGTIYGEFNDGDCSGAKISVSSYYKAIQARYCDYCVCTCTRKPAHKPHLVTAISFREQVTDIYRNMVVVGIRFVKKDFMIHAQIKVGKLKPRKFVDKAEWQEIEKIDYNERFLNFYSINQNNVHRKLELGVDYGHPKTMNLNYVGAPQGYVITGVRFGFASDSLDDPQLQSKSMELQVRVTPFDFYNGKLVNFQKTHWVTPKNDRLKNELIIKYPGHPANSPENHFDSSYNSFIRFQASNLKKDAGQSTVPFFDAQDIAGNPEFPLGGIGIVHRGQEGYGGFLTFIIFEIDFSHYFSDSYV